MIDIYFSYIYFIFKRGGELGLHLLIITNTLMLYITFRKTQHNDLEVPCSCTFCRTINRTIEANPEVLKLVEACPNDRAIDFASVIQVGELCTKLLASLVRIPTLKKLAINSIFDYFPYIPFEEIERLEIPDNLKGELRAKVRGKEYLEGQIDTQAACLTILLLVRHHVTFFISVEDLD